MKNIFILFLFLCLSLNGFAQKSSASARERISTAKIGLITDRLNITPEQAPQFWAIYNEYTDKKKEIRKQLRELRTNDSNLTSTDEQVQKSLQEMITLRQKDVDLEKDYMNKFLKTISPRQLAELYKTEQDFTKLLLERLEEGNTKRRYNHPGN